MYRFITTLLFSILTFICLGQQNIQKAIELAKKYPESNIYITHNDIDFFIEYNKPDRTVIAIQKEKTGILSLKSNVNKIFIKNFNKYSSFIEYARFESAYHHDSKIYDTDYSSNGIFHNDEKLKVIDLYFKQRGDYTSFVTKKRFLDIKYIDPIYLANIDPSEEIKVRITLDQELEFDIIEFNFEKYNISKNYSYDEKQKKHVYEYNLKNPPFISDFDGIRGIAYYLPHLIIVPKEYHSSKYNQKYFKDVKDLYSWYSELVDSVNNEPDQLKPFLASLISKDDNDIDKIKKIYYWVQQNIRYIAFEDGIAGFKPESAQNVFNKKYGDCKGVANLTKELLKLEGFDVRLAWIGTNSRPYDYSLPSLIVDNHMICALFYKDTVYYLDATEKFMPLGINAERIQNKEALIENGDSFVINKIPKGLSAQNLRSRNTQMYITGNNIQGNSDFKYEGESKSNIKYLLNSIENNKKEKELKKYFDSDNINIKNIEYSNINEIDSPFIVNFQYEYVNAVMQFDNELYIKFENYYDYQNSDIDTLFTFDYDMKYKKELESTTSIKVPENYSIEFIPENLLIQNPDFTISINFKKSNNEILYEKYIKLPNGLIHNTNIKEWNNAIKKLNELYNSNIIFKRI